MIFEKRPAEITRYGGDWTDALDTDETIVTSEWFTSGTALEIGSGAQAPALDGALVTVWLLAGTNGQNYCVTNRITTSAGRVLEESFKIQVRAACCAA